MSDYSFVRGTATFGRIEIIPTRERQGNRVYCGSYSIRYDEAGNEISRTENEWLSYVDCGDEESAVLLMALR